jgi:hypothetical protein
MTVSPIRTKWDPWRHCGLVPTLAAVVALGGPVPLFGQSMRSAPDSVLVVPGPQYASPPGGQRWLLGDGYRDLWTAEIRVEVLDLQSFAGGLTPAVRGASGFGGVMDPSDQPGAETLTRCMCRQRGSAAVPRGPRWSGTDRVTTDQGCEPWSRLHHPPSADGTDGRTRVMGQL